MILEGEGFCDRTSDLNDLEVAIFGVSYDPPADNRAWAAMMGFKSSVLSDPDCDLGRALGVEREPDDRLHGIPRRVTFIIDPDGIIRWVYSVPRKETSPHAQLALETVRGLQAG